MAKTPRTTQATVRKEARRKQYAAPALEKGLDIIDLLASEPEPRNLRKLPSRWADPQARFLEWWPY